MTQEQRDAFGFEGHIPDLPNELFEDEKFTKLNRNKFDGEVEKYPTAFDWYTPEEVQEVEAKFYLNTINAAKAIYEAMCNISELAQSEEMCIYYLEQAIGMLKLHINTAKESSLFEPNPIALNLLKAYKKELEDYKYFAK